jgi:methylmalonyl-CoA/ethylmalonyl-CoA epimerase
MGALPGVDNVAQVAFVVRDLGRAMAAWAERGVGPWRVYTFGPDRLWGMTVRGHEQPYAMRLALASAGSTDYELIEPLDGPSLYAEHLAQCGEGLHHLGYYVDDLDATVAAMAERGYAVLQSGRGVGASGDGAFAYFDTARDFGCVLEAIAKPRRMWEPERMIAAGPA